MLPIAVPDVRLPRLLPIAVLDVRLLPIAVPDVRLLPIAVPDGHMLPIAVPDGRLLRLLHLLHLLRMLRLLPIAVLDGRLLRLLHLLPIAVGGWMLMQRMQQMRPVPSSVMGVNRRPSGIDQLMKSIHVDPGA